MKRLVRRLWGRGLAATARAGARRLVAAAAVVASAVAIVAASAAGAEPSRAAWWLAQDGVAPIADLVNTAAPGQPPAFEDRVGQFTVTCEERALLLRGRFPKPSIWRCDLSTFDGQFDLRTLYRPLGNCAFPSPASPWSQRIGALLGDPALGLTHTGPWEIFGGQWLVPTARVALDGTHVYTSWFDLPSLADQEARRVYASFALAVPTAGEHTVRVAFDDFPRHTRWRLPNRVKERPAIEYCVNVLRPHHIGSVALGEDERVRWLEPVKLLPALVGQHPRLPGAAVPAALAAKPAPLALADVDALIEHVDPERGALWEYSDDAESMASENDMDSGKHGMQAAREYDALVGRLAPAAKAAWDDAYRRRFRALYTFFVFQRNYHPTGYAQNHSAATVAGLAYGGAAWDGPEGEQWLQWAVMVCRQRVRLLGRDGGLEWLNEGRDYGLNYFQAPCELIKAVTGIEVQTGPFYANEWRYGLHRAYRFPTAADRRPPMAALARGKANPYVPVPAAQTPENTPTNWHFDDVDQVYLRSDWGEQALRARLWAGSVFGKEGAATAKRYNWAHCQVNQGSVVFALGRHALILEPDEARTYRKSAAVNNCLLVNGSDQWGGGQVWHPRLEPAQVSRIAFYADGTLLAAARADLAPAYPPAARITALSRCLIHLKPDTFLVFDRLVTDGPAQAQWRFHGAYLEPQATAGRYTVFASQRNDQRPAAGAPPLTYEQTFAKLDDVHADLAFLAPAAVPATIGMSDVYYRWSALSLPPRHLQVVQAGDGPLVLLTAVSPRLALAPAGAGRWQGAAGGHRWTVLLPGARDDAVTSDAAITVLAEDPASGAAELYRWGGTQTRYGPVAVPTAAADTFAAFRAGQLVVPTGARP